MTRSHALLGLGVLAFLIVLAVLLYPRAARDPGPDFQSYDGGDAPAEGSSSVATNGAIPEDLPKEGLPRPKPKAPPVEDTLNRPGPDATDRQVLNRRPRTDEEAARSDEEKNVGTLEKKEIRDGIKAVTPLVKVCYEKMLEEFPEAAGKVTIGFRIIGEEGRGRVEMTELDDDGTTLFDQKLHDCLQGRISEAEFEAPSGGAVNVRYPFVFRTDEEE